MASLLIVDDDLDLADVLAEVLRSEGHEVRVARDGKEGLARLTDKKPDVILCDVEMPVLTGPEMAVQILLHDAGLEEIPILLTSGVPDLRRVADAVGTPYFLGKPVSFERLVAKLNQMLRERTPPRPTLRPGVSP
jgi:CheY-like chemotaxis protein